MMEGAYPPGVTPAMLAQIEPREEDKFFDPDPACEYCEHYDGRFCTLLWNNMDESYCIPDRDEREPDDSCDDYALNGEPLEEPKRPERPKLEDYPSAGGYARAIRQYRLDLRLFLKFTKEADPDDAM